MYSVLTHTLRVALCFVFFAHVAYADNEVVLKLEPSSSTVRPGSVVLVNAEVAIGSASCVNAFDISASVSNNAYLTKPLSGESVVSLWVEKPTIANDRFVRMAGGTPNGICGPVSRSTMQFFVHVPKTTTSGEVIVSFDDTVRVFSHTPNGSLANLVTQPARINIRTDAPLVVDDVLSDEIPPLPFTISLQNNPRATGDDDALLLVFNTTDQETGIKEYQIEIRRPHAAWIDHFFYECTDSDFEKISASSPAVFGTTLSFYDISVLAKDFNKNIATATLFAQKYNSLRFFDGVGKFCKIDNPFTDYSYTMQPKYLLIAVSAIIFTGLGLTHTYIFRRRNRQ